MQFNRKVDYGLILLGALKPTYASKRFVSLRAVSRSERLPFAFLEKLAGRLRREGVLEARKGMDGGYRLIRNPKSFTLDALINMFDEPPMVRCLCGDRSAAPCPLASRCPTRKTWSSVQRRITNTLKSVTIAEL